MIFGGKSLFKFADRKNGALEAAVATVTPVDPNAALLDRLRDGYYDFIDLGTCDAGGFDIAARLGGRRGLGFDLEPSVVERNRVKGIDVACMDVRTLRDLGQCVDFAVCSHILEHLPSFDDVSGVVGALSGMCRDYIIVSGPCFEEEDYLYSLNVKLLQSAMRDHTCKFKVAEFITLLHALRLRDFMVALTEEITGTDNHWIYRADEPVPDTGLWTYDKDKHRPKPDITFDREVYRDFVCVIALRPGIDQKAILDDFLWGYDKIVTTSSWLYGERCPD